MNGLDLLLALEIIRNRALDGFFCAGTYLGSEEAYLGLIIIAYLCVSRRLGFRLMMFALSAYAVSVLKGLFATDRPFVMYPDIVHPLALSTAWTAGRASEHRDFRHIARCAGVSRALAKRARYGATTQRGQLLTTGSGDATAMASSFGYASAFAHGCRCPGTDIAGGTTNGGRPPEWATRIGYCRGRLATL